MSNQGYPIDVLARAFYDAMHIRFSMIRYMDRNWEKYRASGEDERIEKHRTPRPDDLIVLGMFQQTWGSTALGFGGLGGAAMTDAYTVIIGCKDEVAVYFDGRFAYGGIPKDEVFYQDLAAQNMKGCADVSHYFNEQLTAREKQYAPIKS